MTAFILHLCKFACRLGRDTSGVMLPYVTIMLSAFIGFSALALDAGRWMSSQTQMQALADALALAGARELDQKSDSQTRATNAINNLVSNGLTGLGYSGSITHSVAFYSALPIDTAGYGGTAAATPQETKFVGVTITPVSIPTILPVSYVKSGASNSFNTSARAIAGFKGRAVCDMPPVFICNPYETAGMTDSTATATLRTNMESATVKRKLMRLDRSSSSPGHFGFLVPPDGCTGASCLRDWIATTHPKACYESPGVDLNTGAVTSVDDAFNVRFDMYKGSLNYSADYAPSVNVRKGYVPGSGGSNKWCSADPASPYLTLPIINTTGNTTSTGNATARKTVTGIPTTDLSQVNASGGQLIADPNNVAIPASTRVASVASPDLTMDTAANTTQTGVSLKINYATSGFPLDSNMTDNTVIFGNGDWNCLDYWTINHTAAAPSGCTKTNPTVSRYDVYRYEIANNLVADWSGDHLSNPTGAGNGTGNPKIQEESGAPYCAGTGTGVDTTTGGKDRRIIYVAVINCLAQASLITGGSTANDIPVADFAKVFMTMPIPGNSDSPKLAGSSLYGEVTGLISSLDSVRIFNQVQLYR